MRCPPPSWLWWRVFVVAALASTAPAQGDVAFARDVLPILQAHCFQCHRGEYTDDTGRVRRPKGGLRLDGKTWILAGGKAGRVLTPGKAAHSPLYARTALPADDDDRMPASGDPLSTAQAAVLQRWIDGGASFGDWVGEAGPAREARDGEANPLAPAGPFGVRSLDLARVAEGLVPLAAATVAEAAGDKAKVTPLWLGSALLRVEYPGHEDDTGDADVAALAPLSDHIAVLVLARTKVSDTACGHIARMRRLVRLDLRDTRTSDAGVARLKALPELGALNLFATDVGDGSVAALSAMPKLAELRLWQTRVTPAGVAKLRQAKPDLDVVVAPELPDAAPRRK